MSHAPAHAERPRPIPDTVTCVGASVRGVAQSAARAGWRVQAIDLFGDADLRASAAAFIAATESGARYPDELPRLVRRLPPSPWCYTGALENHPDVVARIAADRPLAGCPAATLRVVRDPAYLGPVVRAAGLCFPETHDTPSGLPTDGRFLMKPRASAGGRSIATWRGAITGRATTGLVWQRRVTGGAWSAAYVCAAGEARLWGLSRQLVGRRWCGAGPFTYCGSVSTPLALCTATHRRQLERLGRALAGAFGLVGLVGVDLVVDPHGGIHVIEVNPRPTASMELVERSTGRSVAATHLAACGHGPPPADGRPAAAIWAKAVLFAARRTDLDAPRLVTLSAAAADWTASDGWPALADIPRAGTRVDAGRPLLTLFARADEAQMALHTLRRRAAVITTLLSAGEPPLR